MTKINLLPWREELLKRKQKAFLNAIALSVLVGIVILGLLHAYMAGLNTYHEQRNQLLLSEIALLDKKIVDIKNIEEKKTQIVG